MARLLPSWRLVHPRYWLTWLSFGLLRLLAYLPYQPLMAVGHCLGWLFFHVAKRRMRISRTNLRLCFPTYSTVQIEKLARDYAIAFGKGLMGCLIAWWWPNRRLQAYFSVQGLEHLQDALKQGRGVILFTPHMVSLEICGRLLAAYAPVMPTYRRHDNPALEHLVKYHREVYVETTIPRDKPRLTLRMLQRNKAVSILPDQDYAGKNHVFVDFLGVPAATNTTISRFATLSGAPVVPCVVLHHPNTGYQLYIEPALADFPKQPAQDTQRLQAIIERWVQLAPAQYHWMHRRFKTQPNGTPSPYNV